MPCKELTFLELFLQGVLQERSPRVSFSPWFNPLSIGGLKTGYF